MRWLLWMTSSRITILELVRKWVRELALRTIGTSQAESSQCQLKLKCSRKSWTATLIFLQTTLAQSSLVQISNFLSQAPRCSITPRLYRLFNTGRLHLQCPLISPKRSTWASTPSSRQSFKLSRCCRNSSYNRPLSHHQTQCLKWPVRKA